MGNKAGEMPSINELFKETWETFKSSLLSLVIFTVLSLLIGGALLLVLLVIVFGGGLVSGLFSGSFQAEKMLPAILGGAVIGIPLITIIFIVLSLMFYGSEVLIIGEYKNKIALGEILKKSLNLILPLFLVNLLLFIVGVGGFFVFIIPAIIFAFFFHFAPYEVVLGNKKWVEALKSSWHIVGANAGDILVRFLLLIGAYIVWIIIGLLVSILGLIPYIGSVISVFWQFAGIAFGWLVAVYSITIYKQAKAVTPGGKASLKFVWIITVIGWVIAILAIIGTISFIGSIPQSRWQNILASFKGQKDFIGKELSQSEADNLAYSTFIGVNDYRKLKGLPVVEEDSKLCTYAQRRLDKFTAIKKYDSAQGFYEDAANADITRVYFYDYGPTAEVPYYPISSATEPEAIVKYWAGNGSEKAIINSRNYSNGCLRANKDFMILILAGRNVKTGANPAPVLETNQLPTVPPGRPGSKEWDDEFWKNWEEMQKSNAASQQMVEEAQKKFCQENPSLCK